MPAGGAVSETIVVRDIPTNLYTMPAGGAVSETIVVRDIPTNNSRSGPGPEDITWQAVRE
jgi:hypothetical protein